MCRILFRPRAPALVPHGFRVASQKDSVWITRASRVARRALARGWAAHHRGVDDMGLKRRHLQ